jgi:hypothetical protein
LAKYIKGVVDLQRIDGKSVTPGELLETQNGAASRFSRPRSGLAP